MAASATYVRNQLYSIPLKDLQPDPEQPRKYLDTQALEELTASIAQHGILEPILFRQDQQTGLLYVVAGERRCAAARKAGLKEAPAVFIDSQNHAEIALVENLLRQDLTPVEEAEALGRLVKNHDYKQEDLARILGKSQAGVSETLSLNNLPEGMRDECRSDPTVPKRVLVEIAKAKQERGMYSRYRKYRQKEAAQKAKEAAQTTETRKRTPSEALIGAIESLADRIDKTDLGAWQEDEREEFRIAVVDLNTVATERLGAASGAGKDLA